MAHWCTAVDEWGIPDWRNSGAYGATEDWRLSRWRWEFTRRRPDYRADFEKALSNLDDPMALPPDIPPDFAARYHGIRAWPFFHKGAAKYGLTQFFDPVLSDWPSGGPEWNSGLVLGPMHGEESHVTDDGGFEITEAAYMESLTFDLRRPLKEQLREAEAYLEEAQGNWLLYGPGREELYPPGEESAFLKNAEGQVRAPKLHQDKWLTYLRLLDGRASGASLRTLSRILPAHIATRDSKAAHNMLNHAHEQMFRF